MSTTMERTDREVTVESAPTPGTIEGLGVDSAYAASRLSRADEYLARSGPGRTVLNVRKRQVLFTQGAPAGCVFYIQKGWIKLTIASRSGKEATIALHREGDFFGVECIAPAQPLRSSTATAFTSCTLLRIDRMEMLRALKQERSLPGIFLAFLINRCTLLQADLVDHVLNSSEKRLARTLLLLTTLDNEQESAVPYITHETLAGIVGTTRSRISFFMRRFRKLGYIEYNGSLKIRPSIVNVIMHD